MSATLGLFERWKAMKGLGSDRAAAAALGISHAGPAQWRAGRNGAANVIERMAKDLGEDPIPVILQAFAEASRDAADRKTLGRLARSIGAACVALLALAPWSQSARAEGHEAMGAPVTSYTLCEIAHNLIQAAWAWWKDFWSNAPCSPLASYRTPH